VELLAAPVMAGTRYAGRPVYFSDIVVHRDSAARSFADLRGARWAYNEHRESAGRVLLRQARMARFAAVSDHDYDPIRRMAEVGGDTAL
jgi:ABC-type phosphate/phosphonate transport system substrate-binding protein